jgi:hypothetical protein
MSYREVNTICLGYKKESTIVIIFTLLGYYSAVVRSFEWLTNSVSRHFSNQRCVTTQKNGDLISPRRKPGISHTVYVNNRCFKIHSITPWSRVLPEKLKCPELLKKFPAFYGTRRFITVYTRGRHLSYLEPD